MASDPRLPQTTPKTITGLKVYVSKYNGQVIDIAHAVTEISIYESIYTPFLYGELIIVDNSAMLSTFPFVGQERVLIEWQREGRRVKKMFYITDVFDVKQQLEGVGSYGLSITSERQMRNAISMFSKAYRGRGDEIIKAVHDEFLNDDLDVKVKAKTSHSVVFPYMKPIQAIDMIRKHVLAEDNTPMFVYESMYGDKPVLNSLKNMLESKPVFDIKPLKTVNTDPSGAGSRDLSQYRGQVYEALITRGYDTLNMMTKGAFAASATVIDISTKEASRTDFSFKEHAPPIAKNWVTEFFEFDRVRIYNQYNSRGYIIHENKLSFCDDTGNAQFPNITTLNERDYMALVSYAARLNTINIAVFMNSVPDLEVGKTVTYTQPRFSPKLNPKEDSDDKVNSGTYLIGAIRHYIKNLEYTMSIELIRDGMGEKADFYPNGAPNVGAPPVTRKSVLKEFDPPPRRTPPRTTPAPVTPAPRQPATTPSKTPTTPQPAPQQSLANPFPAGKQYVAADFAPSKYAASIAQKINTLDPSVRGLFAAGIQDYLKNNFKDGRDVSIGEAYRSPERSAQLAARYAAGTGGRAAPAGKSWHNYGAACDLCIYVDGKWDQGTRGDSEYTGRARASMSKYGLVNDLSGDSGHFYIKALGAGVPKALQQGQTTLASLAGSKGVSLA